MTTNTQNNTPSLRFPEFTDEWELKKLDDVATFQKEKIYFILLT